MASLTSLSIRRQKPFTRWRWRIEYLLFLLLITPLEWLPIPVAMCVGRMAGWLAYWLLPSRRRIVRNNLAISFGKKASSRNLFRDSKEVFCRIGANLLASFPTACIKKEKLARHLDIEGEEHLKKALANQQGAIGVLAHMGNWELLAQLPHIHPVFQLPFGALYRPLNNPLINQSIENKRQRRGTQLFSKQARLPITPMIDFLEKKQGLLGILADQRAGNHGLVTSFFGTLTGITPLPALLHKRSQAPLVPIALFSHPTKRFCWKMRIFPALPSSQDIATATRLVAQGLQQMIELSPLDYFWMQERWKPSKKYPLGLTGKRGISLQQGVQLTPFKLLVLLPEDASYLKARAKALLFLAQSRPDMLLFFDAKYAMHRTFFPEIDPAQKRFTPMDKEHLRSFDAIIDMGAPPLSLDVIAQTKKKRTSLILSQSIQRKTPDNPDTWLHFVKKATGEPLKIITTQ